MSRLGTIPVFTNNLTEHRIPNAQLGRVLQDSVSGAKACAGITSNLSESIGAGSRINQLDFKLNRDSLRNPNLRLTAARGQCTEEEDNNGESANRLRKPM